MRKVLLLSLAGVGLCSAWALGRQEKGTQEPVFAAEAVKLLDDRQQPWWNKHRPPKNTKPVSYSMHPDDPGGRVDPPIYTAQMPLEVAGYLLTGGQAPKDNPLAGRPVVLLDVRRRSEFLAENIPGSVNIPGRDFDASLESGELSRMDRKTVLVVFGSKWPHFEIISKLRGPKGFEALYAMEGLEAWKARKGPFVRDEKLAHFLKETEAERKAATPPPPPPELEPLPGMDPKALHMLLEAKVDIINVFVGDRTTYESGHVPGAWHVPVKELEQWFADVDKNQLIMVMCGCCMGKRGGPSENGLNELKKLGFTRVMHLDGHMNAWKIAGLPVETDDPPPRKKKN